METEKEKEVKALTPIFDPNKTIDECVAMVLSLPKGTVWQRVGLPTSGDTLPGIAEGLLKTLKMMGKPEVIPIQNKSMPLGPPSDELITEAVRHMVEERLTDPPYANSIEFGIEMQRSMENSKPGKDNFPSWGFYLQTQSDILPLAQRRTLFSRNSATYTYPAKKT